MGISILAGLSGALILLLVPYLGIRRRIPVFRAREQAFRFHELRDRLQMLAIDKKIDPASHVYEMLMGVLNIAIRNAGAMKLRDMLELSDRVRHRLDVAPFEHLERELKRHDPDVQDIASDLFKSFSEMLISNDVAYVMLKVVEAAAHGANATLVNAIKAVVRKITPQYAQAVREARRYQHWGDRLTPNAA